MALNPKRKRNHWFWEFLYGLREHAGKILWLPLIASSWTFIGNLILALADDGTIDEQEFHQLLQGASGTEMVALAFVMALLKLRKP